MYLLSRRRLINSLSLSVRDSELSSTSMIRSAASMDSIALSTPIFSTTSSVSRIPAVSISLRVIPPRLIYSSRVSLVVPSISVTMALSVPVSIFMMEDLPTFGLPTIAVLIPSRMMRPSSLVLMSVSISLDSPSIISSSFSL